MQFRIRSLMIVVVSSSILLATWHLNPQGRFDLLSFMVLFAVLIIPFTFASRSRLGPWSMRRKLGASAYFLAVGIAYAAITTMNIVYKLGLNERIATWPG